MEKYRQLIRWQSRHNTIGFDLVRMFMGVALFVRGIIFMQNPETLQELAGDGGTAVSSVEGYVIWAHLIGGLLLAFGLLTRIAALIQIPILANAVFFVHLEWGFAEPNQSLELSVLVLVLLAIIFIYGAGRLSVDYRLFGKVAKVDQVGSVA